MLRRTRLNKATGKTSIETAYGVTSHTPDTATAHKLLSLNRGHWCIENTAHHCLDWSFDEDRCRIRTGYGPEKHHPPATLRHPTHQGSWTQCRRDPATTEQKCPLRLRLPQNDGQHPTQDKPLNPSLPSTGRPNQTARSSPGPVPPEWSATPTDNPNPAVHPGINKRGPSANLPCPIRHAQKRRNPSMMQDKSNA